jgi:DNA polymerase-3 subunit alpha
MNGAHIEAPCVNNSEYLTTIYDDDIYIGFIHIKSLETKVAQAIGAERQRNGRYANMENFLRRIDIGLEQLRILIRIGGFRFTGKSKQRLLWEAMLFFSQAKNRNKAPNLFDTEPKEYPLPPLVRHENEDAFDELELLGFPLCDPFSLLASPCDEGDLASNLLQKVEKQVQIVGYVVTTKDTYTKSRQPMHFGTFLDREGQVFDTVHFPDIAQKYPFRGRGFYNIRGNVTEDFGVAMIEVTFMEKLPMIHKRAEEFMRENIHYGPRIPFHENA